LSNCGTDAKYENSISEANESTIKFSLYMRTPVKYMFMPYLQVAGQNHIIFMKKLKAD
jgi:hypothetical protein